MYAFLLFNTYSVVYLCSYLVLLLLYIYLNLLGPLNCKVYLCIFVYISSILFGLYLIQPIQTISVHPIRLLFLPIYPSIWLCIYLSSLFIHMLSLYLKSAYIVVSASRVDVSVCILTISPPFNNFPMGLVYPKSPMPPHHPSPNPFKNPPNPSFKNSPAPANSWKSPRTRLHILVLKIRLSPFPSYS